MPMGYTNATPMLLIPSCFFDDQVLSGRVAAQSPPSLTTLVSFATATMGKTVCVGVDPGFPHCHQSTPSLGISSFVGAECSHSSSIRNLTHIHKIICLMAAVSRPDKVANGSIQKQLLAICSIFGDRILRVGLRDVEWRKQYCCNSSLSVPQGKFSIHAYINHLCRMIFPEEDQRAWRIPHW